MTQLTFISMYEFKQFMEIVLWIAVPGTILAITITTLVHYRRKKKAAKGAPAYIESNFQFAMVAETEQLPDWLASSKPGNASLTKRYEAEIRRYKENYSNLEQDFRQLEDKYTGLLNKAYHTEIATDDKLVNRLRQEIKEYKLKIAQLQQAIAVSQKDKDSETEDEYQASLKQQRILQDLQEEIRIQKEKNDEQFNEISRLRELLTNSNESLTASKKEADNLQKCFSQQVETAGQQNLTEQKYLADMLEEKKLQTDFLQKQLDQRVKNYHQLEERFEESTLQLTHLRKKAADFDQQISQMREELSNAQQDAAISVASLELSKEEGIQHKEIIRTKIEQIESLETGLKELQEQECILKSEIADKRDTIATLQENVQQEKQKVSSLNSKLELSSQLLIKIYTELAKSFSSELVHLPNSSIAPSLLDAAGSKDHKPFALEEELEPVN